MEFRRSPTCFVRTSNRHGCGGGPVAPWMRVSRSPTRAERTGAMHCRTRGCCGQRQEWTWKSAACTCHRTTSPQANAESVGAYLDQNRQIRIEPHATQYVPSDVLPYRGLRAFQAPQPFDQRPIPQFNGGYKSFCLVEDCLCPSLSVL